MDNIATLERKLAACKKQENIRLSARVPSGVIIDLSSPEGNIYYIMGVCQRLAHDYKLPDEEFAQYETELNRIRKYDDRLAHCQKWFGLIYLKD